jgi:hypothetical protein
LFIQLSAHLYQKVTLKMSETHQAENEVFANDNDGDNTLPRLFHTGPFKYIDQSFPDFNCSLSSAKNMEI